ncbi:MAG TPA: S49 family peptidase [Phycisphaerae bacterium]|nr:S49 family peptidase [Phycisphaerae bacterium]
MEYEIMSEPPEVTFTKRIPQPSVLTVQCVAPAEKKRSILGKLLKSSFVMLFVLSVLINVYIFAIIAGMSASPMSTTVLSDGDNESVIAVYTVGGTITPQTASEFGVFYRQVRDDKNIKAVVIHVDSPGGYITPSDQISRMVGEMREKLNRTVIVSMGSCAASGGYYISVPAERIFAEPTAIVGSIGVIGMYPNVKGLTEKIGIEVIVIRATKCTRFKAKPDPFSSPENETRISLQKMLDEYHEMFIDVVTATRPGIVSKSEEVTVPDATGKDVTFTETSPFNGQIFLAKEAKARNLIDEIGGLDVAINWLVKNKNLDGEKVVHYSKSPTLVESMGFQSSGIMIDNELVQQSLSPRIMMLWKVD